MIRNRQFLINCVISMHSLFGISFVLLLQFGQSKFHIKYCNIVSQYCKCGLEDNIRRTGCNT